MNLLDIEKLIERGFCVRKNHVWKFYPTTNSSSSVSIDFFPETGEMYLENSLNNYFSLKLSKESTKELIEDLKILEKYIQ